MYQPVYVSEAAKDIGEQDIVDILKTARSKNSQVDVTGLLLYQHGHFVQVLEGPEQAVREIFARIEKDIRHKNVEIVIEQVTNGREFGSWKMSFADVKLSQTGELEGISNYLDTEHSDEEIYAQTSIAKTFLGMFQRLT